MHRSPSPLILLTVLPAVTVAKPPTYLDSRTVLISFHTVEPTPVERVALWATGDDGRTWQLIEAERAGPTAVRFEAPRDGRYGFYLVLENAAGRSAEPPEPGTPPLVTVVVDTTAPTLHLRAAAYVDESTPPATLRLPVTVIDDNLGSAGTRLFYRTADALGWRDAGPMPVRAGQIDWPLPSDVAPPIDVRVVVTDLAGNRAVAEMRDVRGRRAADVELAADATLVPPSPPAVSHPAVAPTVSIPSPAATGEQHAAPKADSAATQPAVVAEAESAQRQREQAAALRRQAADFVQRGEFAAAIEQFSEALKLAPQDASLLVELGDALVRVKRFDDAGRRYQDALARSPQQRGALEGLALVAVSQRRYHDARRRLQELAELEPQDARAWLRLGDVERKLSNHAAARHAWSRVLQIHAAPPEVRAAAQERLRTASGK